MTPPPALAVAFDFGGTLAALDHAFLSARLRERGLGVSAERLRAAEPRAQAAYDAGIAAGETGHPWRRMMGALLHAAGVPYGELGEAVEWLWAEQPARNLWRSPIPGMIELVRRLGPQRTAVISNSEGRLRELAAELGWEPLFCAIADSGVLRIEKPDPRIFRWTAQRLGVPVERVVHVGDSFAADVEGALGAGMSAIWFGGDADGARDLPAVRVARDAGEVEAALRGFGLRI